MDLDDLVRRLDALADEPDKMRRRIVALGVVDGAPRARTASSRSWSAVVRWRSTPRADTPPGDVDLALAHSDWKWTARSPTFGFEKRRPRFWLRPNEELVFEAPAPPGVTGRDGTSRTILDVDGLRVVVIGVEDLLIDRVRALVHWKSDEDGRWAQRLATLYVDSIDWDYVVMRGLPRTRARRAAVAKLQGASAMKWEDFREEVRRRKRERWAEDTSRPKEPVEAGGAAGRGIPNRRPCSPRSTGTRDRSAVSCCGTLAASRPSRPNRPGVAVASRSLGRFVAHTVDR